MLVRSRGIGEYPGYYCYDSARPSWLPYWIDSVTESLCKWSPKTIAGNIAACATGDPSCGNPSEAQKNPDISGPGVAPAGAPTNLPSCGAFTRLNMSTLQCDFDPSTITDWLLIGGLGLVLLTVLPSVLGRR